MTVTFTSNFKFSKWKEEKALLHTKTGSLRQGTDGYLTTAEKQGRQLVSYRNRASAPETIHD